jgi:hypothetical protein
VTEEDVPFRYRLVATDRTRRELATAFLRWFVAQPRTWLLVDLFWVFFALLLFSGMDEGFSVGARVFWSLVFALVPTVLLVVLLGAMIYVRTLRGARLRVHAGAVLESGFGEHTLVLRNPVESSKQDYRTIRSITARGDHVFIRRVGPAPVAVWPRALFPDEEIERIRRFVDRPGG